MAEASAGSLGNPPPPHLGPGRWAGAGREAWVGLGDAFWLLVQTPLRAGLKPQTRALTVRSISEPPGGVRWQPPFLDVKVPQITDLDAEKNPQVPSSLMV